MTDPAGTALDYHVLPPNRMRRGIARRMLASVTEKPHVTLHADANVGSLLELWRNLRSNLPEAKRPELSITAVVAAVVIATLVDGGRLNGRIEDGETRIYRPVNLGVAVDTDDGLVVPVLRDAASKSIFELGSELYRLSQKARTGRLAPEDLQDATFTLTNLGMFGVRLFTPIINPPQLAILGVGSIVDRLELSGGTVVATPSMGVSLSFDHAVMDGANAARSLQLLTSHLESPETALRNGGAATRAALGA